jgi:hypothetical protein
MIIKITGHMDIAGQIAEKIANGIIRKKRISVGVIHRQIFKNRKNHKRQITEAIKMLKKFKVGIFTVISNSSNDVSIETVGGNPFVGFMFRNMLFGDMHSGVHGEIIALEIKQPSGGKSKSKSSLSKRTRFRILKRDKGLCKLCGRGADDGVKLEVDHIRPRAKGGTDDDENLQTLCKDCNRGKGATWDGGKKCK